MPLKDPAARKAYLQKWENTPKAKAYQKAYRTANRARRKHYNEMWVENNKARYMFLRCKNRAKERDLEFDLTQELVEELLVSMKCSVTGMPLVWGRSISNPWAPSIDRIDNSKGYVTGNVRIVCWIYNTMRLDWNDEDVLAVAKAIVQKAGH